MKSTRMMKLGAFLPAPGHHVAAWRHPQARADGGMDLQYYTRLAQTAERGKFDMMFLSDGVGVRTHYRDADELSRWGRMVHFEPLTLLSALAVVTEHLGLTATASTTYHEPFHVARFFASIDHLSQGRAGWNIVTSCSDAEARNFNREQQPDHATRYRRAREFMTVVSGLWDSWEDDAFLYDKGSGRYFEPKKLHVLNHKGDFFSVKGPLNVARSPQGYPVLVQAGASEDGQDFAAQWAEVVFTACQTLEQGQSFYQNIKDQVAKHGRDPDHVKVMPGVFTVVGASQREAEDTYAVLQDCIDPVVALGLLSDRLGFDVSGLALDAPLPELTTTESCQSRAQLVYEQSQREGLSVRQLAFKLAGGRGHRSLVGTPSSIADQLEEWFNAGAADGFNVMPAYLPDELTKFVDLVVPELQRRGLFRREYEGKTLRENLGIPRPSHPRATDSVDEDRC